MSSELTILALYGILIILLILIETLLSVLQLGIPYMSSSREEGREKSGMAGRAARAVVNCGLGMALFAPAILILDSNAAFTATTLLAAQIFLIARVIYAGSYLFGISFVRTVSFVAALLANLNLYFLAL